MSRLREEITRAVGANRSFAVARPRLADRIASPSLVTTYECWLRHQKGLIQRARRAPILETDDEDFVFPLTRLVYSAVNNDSFLEGTGFVLAENQHRVFTIDDIGPLLEDDLFTPLHVQPAEPLGPDDDDGENSLSSQWIEALGRPREEGGRKLTPWSPSQEHREDCEAAASLVQGHVWFAKTTELVGAYETWVDDQYEKIAVDLKMVSDPIAWLLSESSRLALQERVRTLRDQEREGNVGWIKQQGQKFAKASVDKKRCKKDLLDLFHRYNVNIMRRKGVLAGYTVAQAQKDRRKLRPKLRKKHASLQKRIETERAKLRRKEERAIEKLSVQLAAIEEDREQLEILRSGLETAKEAKHQAKDRRPPRSLFRRRKPKDPVGEHAYRQAAKAKTAAKKAILGFAHRYNVNRKRSQHVTTGYSAARALQDLDKTARAMDDKTRILRQKLRQHRLRARLTGNQKVYGWRREIRTILRDGEKANRLIGALLIAQRDKARARSDVKRGIRSIKELNREVKSANVEFMATLAKLRKIWAHIQTIRSAPEKRKHQLKIVQEHIREQIAAMMELLEQRELLKLEVEQLEKTLSGKMRRGLKIVCGFSKVAYPLILRMGMLVAGDGSAKMAALLNSPSIIGGGVGLLQGQGTKSGLSMGSGLLSTAIARHIKNFGTGEMNISLSLGLAYGTGKAGFFEAGVSLVYTATLRVDDDRKFRASGSIALNGKIRGGHKAVLEAALEADLVKSTTTFVFNDVYHWAAWLCLKWGNAAAWALALGSNVYKSSRTGAPTREEAEYLRMLAETYAAESKSIRTVFQNIEPFMDEPVSRGDALEAMTNIKGSVNLGSMLGVGASRQRPTRCTFYRRFSRDGALKEEENALARQCATQFTLKAGLLRPSVKKSHIEKNPNPDNDGDYLHFEIKAGASETTLLGKTGPSPQAPDWLKNMEESIDVFDIEDGMKGGSLMQSSVLKIGREASLACAEINCIRVPLKRKNKNKWRIQYFRGLHARTMKISSSIPIVAAPGLKVTFGASFSLKRSYGEVLFPETLTYLHTVYNGFAAIASNPVRVRTDAKGNKIDHSGAALWELFKKNHAWALALLYRRLGADFSPAREEIDEAVATNQSLTIVGQQLKSSPSETTLEAWLEKVRTGPWQRQKDGRWKPHRRTVRFSINPVRVLKQWHTARSQKGKLQRKELGFDLEEITE